MDETSIEEIILVFVLLLVFVVVLGYFCAMGSRGDTRFLVLGGKCLLFGLDFFLFGTHALILSLIDRDGLYS